MPKNDTIVSRTRGQRYGPGVKAIRRFTVRPLLPEPLDPLGELHRICDGPGTRLPGTCSPTSTPAWAAVGGDPVRLLGAVRRSGWPSWRRRPRSCAGSPTPRRSARLPDRAALVPARMTGRPARARSPTSRPSSASPRCCRSTPAAWASWPATTSRPPATSACRSSASACSTGTATSASRCPATAGSRSATRCSTRTSLPLTSCARPTAARCGSTIGLPGPRDWSPQVWQAQVGRVPLLLLDTDIEDNAAGAPRGHRPALRRRQRAPARTRRCCWASAASAPSARSARLTGAPAPEVFHTNEGHAGFLGLERIRELIDERGLTSTTALAGRPGRHRVHHPHPGPGRHRPLPARPGRRALRRRRPGGPACRSSASSALGAEDDPAATPLQHGRHGPAAGPARQRRRHAARRGLPGDVRRPVAGLRRRRRCRSPRSPTACTPRPGCARRSSSWPSASWARACWPTSGVGRASTTSPTASCGAAAARCATGWSTRSRRRLRGVLARSAARPRPSSAGPTDVLDPDVLTIGFARRVPSYKRLTLMLRDRERLTALLLRPASARSSS